MKFQELDTTLDYAKFYVDKMGFSVIPLKPKSKIPVLKSWKEYQDREPTNEELLKWFDGTQNNIGIVTGRRSNLTVVDIDSLEGIQFAKENNFSVTPCVKTGKEYGFHNYYQYLENSRNFQKRADVPGVDLRSDGGYIVAPPSIHESGKPYKWVDDRRIGEIPFTECPDILFSTNGDSRKFHTENGKIKEGKRDDYLTSLAGYMRARGISEDAIFSALMIENHQKCAPPLPEKQVKKIAKSVSKYEPKKNEKKGYFDINESGRKTFIPFYLAEELMEENIFINCNQNLYVYKNGVYIPQAEELIKRRCREKLKKESRNNRINEIVSHIFDMTFTEHEKLNTQEWLINLKNGMYDVKNKKLLPHGHEYLSTIQIPVIYNPEATCPMIDMFFQKTLPEDCINLARETFGYCLVQDVRLETAFMLTGTGANGKSTFLYLLEKFIGQDNVSKIPLQELDEHRFKRAELFGKLVNLFADLDRRALKSTSYFKTVVSGDSIDAEEKHKPPFFFKPFAQLIFSANELPPSYDNTDAFWRRWRVIPFPHTFKGQTAQKDLKSWITTDEELSGLLNHALRGLETLYERQEFEEPETIRQAKEEYKKQNDPIAAFISECCVLAHDRYCERGKLYDEFTKFCEKNGYKALTRNKFYERIRAISEVSEGKTFSERFFSGISLEEAF